MKMHSPDHSEELLAEFHNSLQKQFSPPCFLKLRIFRRDFVRIHLDLRGDWPGAERQPDHRSSLKFGGFSNG